MIHLIYLVIVSHGRSTVTRSIARTQSGCFALRLDVEVGDEDEANETIAAAADVVMLDNIEGSEFASVACRLRECGVREGKRFLLETSGGITESNLRERAMGGK